MPFAELGLADPLLQAIAELKYQQPSPIQSQAIPQVLAGRDLLAAAQTGTGKTAGFGLPLLQRLMEDAKHPRSSKAPANQSRNHSKNQSKNRPIRALVLTPTRELAAQVSDSLTAFAKYLPLTTCVVFGGVKINPQIQQLKRGVDLLVATPGRLLDLVGQGEVDLSRIEYLVLDEADRMLDMGFIRDIRRVLALLPKQRQTLLFSATFSQEIRELAQGLLIDPVEVDVNPRNSTAKRVRQRVHPVDKGRKPDLLKQLIHEQGWEQVLVFTRTKHGANRLTMKLEKAGIRAAAIHGNKSQGARTRALSEFKDGTLHALVATDIAARGLDIAELPYVVNFELPQTAEDYVHRIGRTGRAGREGEAISLVSSDERAQLRAIERLIEKPLDLEPITGFEPGPDWHAASDKPKPRRSSNRKPGSRAPRAGRPRRAPKPAAA